MNPETFFDPYGCGLDSTSGTIAPPCEHTSRLASAMRGYYADGEALERLIQEHGDPLHYEVFEKVVPHADGHLLCGISKLQPGLIGEECFMTKGHYHKKPGTAEVYLCLRGEGFMLMKTPDGSRCVAEPMARDRLVYVPPYWAHRSINTGREPLITFYVYPADAGHNYGDIEKQGFPRRIFCREGRVDIEPARTGSAG